MTHRLFRAASTFKTTTGLFGLAVNPNPVPELAEIYSQVIEAVSVLPQDSVYRQATLPLFTQRLAILDREKDVQRVEELIADGCVEQLIQRAECELELAGLMSGWKVNSLVCGILTVFY